MGGACGTPAALGGKHTTDRPHLVAIAQPPAHIVSCMPPFPQGRACDVSQAADVRALADYAVEQLGSIDLW
jgi:NAD(P)-dependent dehydrogenase (short-subunit alcohol dehydrogenase family)